ncbi:hypothetical protein BLS_004084 [Venturia inaequalis]|uniref:Uncharacterized protein n=1 Tax=Venturia inaequalis TaxID=5025 RepID=A0A8H3UNC0_VENIN|nr:hypothetical protein BLS_004084 [Venturia inaequalis]
MVRRSSLVLALLGHGLDTLAQSIQSQFNQVINLNGDMILNSVQFPDGSRIETFSQTQRQMLVNQNQAPLPGNQVTGSTGNPFIMLSTTSLVIQTNGGTDLVGAQIELAMNTQLMQQNNISPDNAFVAKLAPDRRSWMVMDGIKSVNTTDNTVRLVKMNQIDGEYAALGRNTRETGLFLTQFGTQQNNGFSVSGSGVQENEFSDGFRMSVRATQPMLINSNVINGISSTMLSALPPGTQSVNNYRYKVNTNLAGVVSNINRMIAVVQIPINPVRLQIIAKNMGAGPNSNIRLSIAQRGILINPGGAQGSQGIGNQKRQDSSSQVNSNGTFALAASNLLLSPTFTPIAANAVLDQMNGRLAIPVAQLDGEFIITVAMANGAQGSQQPQAAGTQGQGSQRPQGQLQPQGQGQIEPQGQQGQSPQGQAAPLNEPQAQRPQGQASQQNEPKGTAPRPGNEPAPAAASAARPAGEPAPQGSAPRPAGSPPPAGAIPSPQVEEIGGAPASAPVPPRPVKRQFGVAGQPATGGYVEVSMAWINMMASNQLNGLPLNVAAMMDGMLAPGQTSSGATTQAASIGSPGQASSVSGLLSSGFKARKFKA